MTMSITDVLADQMRLPHGPLAPFAAHTLNRRNAALIARAIDALDVRPDHRLLDVGFGGAISLRLFLDRVRGGQVCGIDPSREMVRRAHRMYFHEVEAGRLVLEPGRVEAIPFEGGSFDRILTCQTVYFWSDVRAGLSELHRVLRPGGLCAVAMMPQSLQEDFGFRERGYNTVSHDELGALLESSGFKVSSCPPPEGGPCWVLLAERPLG
ncbi:MAG TPA: class I SAM-dependent methyltransferase [Acidimicrobiales bacterium]|nr:class I SAM-dependent methyltransferase [Acidimicrobiales bacterium]